MGIVLVPAEPSGQSASASKDSKDEGDVMTDTPLTVEELAGLGRGGVAVLRAHFDKMLATIDALTTENATLKAALGSIVSIGRLENYADLLASGERITFSPELRETMKLPGSRARAAMEGQRG